MLQTLNAYLHASGGGPTDPFISNTVMLLGFDSESGGHFTDESPAAHGADTNSTNNPVFDTSVKKFGAGSCKFEGNDFLIWGDHADFEFGSGQFTMELWIRFTGGLESFQDIINRFGSSGSRSYIFQYRGADATNNLAFIYSTTGANTVQINATWSPSIDTWYHIAVDRDASNKFRIYVDGAMIGSATAAVTIFDSAQPLRIGSNPSVGGSQFVNGYMDELRITKGVARYASDSGYTVPTAAFPRS